MSFSLQYAGDSIWYGSFSLLAQAGICHGISTRFGGSSQSPYASMNLALHTGDDPAAVIENRQRFCRALDVDFSRLCTCEQVHGDKIFKVTDKEAGRGCFQLEDSIAGIDAVDRGQMEAARSLGLNGRQAMVRVILPQAVKNILPALCNEFVSVIKETSLASTFFIGDIMSQYKIINGFTFLIIEPLLIAGIIYFIITFVLSKGIAVLERRMKASD